MVGLLIPVQKVRLIHFSRDKLATNYCYVLEENLSHVFSDLEFSFVPGRGTETATFLVMRLFPIQIQEVALCIHVRWMQKEHLMLYLIVSYLRRNPQYYLNIVDTSWLTGTKN